jgi:iron complex outermembrane receptor protein
MKTIYKSCYFSTVTPFSILAQNTINGTVLDNITKQPIQGKYKCTGTTNGVSTDFDGKFQLSNVKRGNAIVFSFIGYKKIVITTALKIIDCYTGGRSKSTKK